MISSKIAEICKIETEIQRKISPQIFPERNKRHFNTCSTIFQMS